VTDGVIGAGHGDLAFFGAHQSVDEKRPVRERLHLIEKTVDPLSAALLWVDLEVRLQDDVRVFVPQPVKPVVGQIEREDVLTGNIALDQLPDALTQQGGLAAPPNAGDHRNLARQTANGGTPEQQSVRRFKALVFVDDSFQSFNHDMARCAPCSFWQPVSFMLGVPE